jgi:hypothetical protein
MARNIMRRTLPAVLAAAVCTLGVAIQTAHSQDYEYETSADTTTGDIKYYDGEYVDETEYGPVEEIQGAAPAHMVHPAIANGRYTAPGYGVPAALYPAPRPIAVVPGSVYYTYEPYRPHELMYRHYSVYTNRYQSNGYRGKNRTSVLWTYGTLRKTMVP